VARERGEQARILERLIEVSALQLCFLRENRIDELLEAQSLRDGLFHELGSKPAEKSPELAALARELAESDRELSIGVSSVMESIAAKLGQVKTGMSAMKAYNRY